MKILLRIVEGVLALIGLFFVVEVMFLVVVVVWY